MAADTCFGAFFTHPHLAPLFADFFVVHITAPGQQPNADNLPSSYTVTFESLVAQVDAVRKHFELRSFFGLGVGLGAVVFLHYACHPQYKTHLRGQILIAATHKASGWAEWMYARSGAIGAWLLGTNDNLIHSQLLARYYDAEGAEREPDAYAQCAESIRQVNP